jgi:D-aminopeptidase
LIFSLSTKPRKGETPVDLMTLGNAAAHCVARSIARGVYLATPAENDLLKAWSEYT